MQKHGRGIDWFLIGLLFLFVFLPILPLAKAELLSPDASLYIDMGRNLLTGKGPVASCNTHQFWQGHYYPFLPYIHPLYPVFAGAFFLPFFYAGFEEYTVLRR